ncbi:Molecular chaperone (DnaJ superfamily) [Klebsormidium nitens]|uniref:Molecular chaperone (DnaJ superfamily) n=1 Tax=Klebsormidium nitens TaxID=105231 RepID=A0A1Y1IH46_KLENI|nr:Molecular chaperone (DnaJ superfamily) [Klebsormidium nitens]|eukprot:GAQ89973.1 Molecular chaperone (DnaJ superfamily) [Klebsormidium nitens]
MASSASSLFVQPLVWGGFSTRKVGAPSRRMCPSFYACPSIAVAAAGRNQKKGGWVYDKRSFQHYAGAQAGRFPHGMKTRDNLNCRRHVRGRKGTTTAAFDGYDQGTEIDILGETIAEDFYSVLGLSPEASGSQIRKAYYGMMKECHPDLTGEHPDSTAFCKFINEVYEVLSDPDQRAIYDEINGFTLTSQNPFFNTTLERDQAFVDEFSCIGCKNCANCAPQTFDIEPEHGRARVMDQAGEAPELVQEAIDTCPVSCIHWVTLPQLTLLEDEMRRLERVNVGLMLAGQGHGGQDVFSQAAWRWDKRQARAVETARAKAYKEKQAPPGKKVTPFWAKAPWEMAEDLVGGTSYESDDEKEKREKTATGMSRAKAMAAAARRWRDASRAGRDRKPKFSLPAPKEEELVRR